MQFEDEVLTAVRCVHICQSRGSHPHVNAISVRQCAWISLLLLVNFWVEGFYMSDSLACFLTAFPLSQPGYHQTSLPVHKATLEMKFDLLGWLTVTTTRPTIDLTTVWPTEALAHTLRNPAALSDNWLYFGVFSSATLYSRSLPYLFNLISSFTFVCGRIPQCIKVHVRLCIFSRSSLSHVVCYGMVVCVVWLLHAVFRN